jgi:hypothetical protein
MGFFGKKEKESNRPGPEPDSAGPAGPSPKFGAERRKYSRINKNFVLSYSTQADPDKKIEITQLKNISRGGMCFITARSFAPDTALSIELKTPFISETTCLQGRVLKSHEKAKGLLYETRLQFTELSPHGQFLLDKLIEFIVKEDGKGHA